jgi:hypothetical protein
VETDDASIGWSVQGRPGAFVEVVQPHEVSVHGWLCSLGQGRAYW